ncbi:IS3 family transposase, partial [Solibacillus cecembensis]
MGTRVSYPYEVKMKAIELRLAGVSTKQVLMELNIRNKTQVETWMRWYKNGEIHRFEQPVGKQYTFDKGPEYENEQTKLEVENRYLK